MPLNNDARKMFTAQIADFPDDDAREELLGLVCDRVADKARLRFYSKRRQFIAAIIAEDERVAALFPEAKAAERK